MHIAEQLSIAVRHHKYLKRLDWMWNRLRPLYNRLINVAGKGGLERVINGTDSILIAPKFRAVKECYEPDVWDSLMNEIKPGDTFADVGVYIGLYTIAVAKRVGTAGHVYAFEPDPTNYNDAQEHIKLNALEGRVELVHAAVGACNEMALSGCAPRVVLS